MARTPESFTEQQRQPLGRGSQAAMDWVEEGSVMEREVCSRSVELPNSCHRCQIFEWVLGGVGALEREGRTGWAGVWLPFRITAIFLPW